MRGTIRGALLPWVVVVAFAAPAVAAPSAPRDTATSALERAAFIALPAVYEVRGELQIDAIVAGRRRIPVDRTVPFRGTAFGVAPGRVVTALHLLRPPTQTILDELRTGGLQNLPDASATTRVLTQPVTTVTLTRARSASECLEGAPTAIAADVVTATDTNGDLVLLTIDDLAAPTLTLDDGLTAETPVAVVGFGDQQGATPAIRRGTVTAAAAIGQDDRFATLDVAIVRGDSGGPVVDIDGHSRGVVLRRATDEVAPVMAQAKSVRELLARDDLIAVPSLTTTRFREAMAAFWARDYRTAQQRLSALTGAYTDTALIECEHDRAAALAATAYAISGPSPTRRAILALGAMATLAAGILGVLRVRRHAD